MMAVRSPPIVLALSQVSHNQCEEEEEEGPKKLFTSPPLFHLPLRLSLC
jgi:hypothetical protein